MDRSANKNLVEILIEKMEDIVSVQEFNDTKNILILPT